MTTLVLWWLAIAGVWPLADPGHDDLSSPLVWFDLALHWTAFAILANREIDRRAEKRATARWLCGEVSTDDGRPLVCDRPIGHEGWHVDDGAAWNGSRR